MPCVPQKIEELAQAVHAAPDITAASLLRRQCFVCVLLAAPGQHAHGVTCALQHLSCALHRSVTGASISEVASAGLHSFVPCSGKGITAASHLSSRVVLPVSNLASRAWAAQHPPLAAHCSVLNTLSSEAAV